MGSRALSTDFSYELIFNLKSKDKLSGFCKEIKNGGVSVKASKPCRGSWDESEQVKILFARTRLGREE